MASLPPKSATVNIEHRNKICKIKRISIFWISESGLHRVGKYVLASSASDDSLLYQVSLSEQSKGNAALGERWQTSTELLAGIEATQETGRDRLNWIVAGFCGQLATVERKHPDADCDGDRIPTRDPQGGSN
jgi:hypothetical protein